MKKSWAVGGLSAVLQSVRRFFTRDFALKALSLALALVIYAVLSPDTDTSALQLIPQQPQRQSPPAKPEKPKAPERSEKPEAPEKPETPKATKAPEKPEKPESPEKPAAPKIPAAASTNDTAKTK